MLLALPRTSSIKFLLLLATFIHSKALPQKKSPDAIVYPVERPNIRENPLMNQDQSYYHQEYHHHHHHHPQHYHHQMENEDYDDFGDFPVRPGFTANNKKTLNKSMENEIPIDFVAKLNGESYTVNDLLIHYVEGYEDEDFIASRFGEETERSVGQLAKMAFCMPELQTVSLKQSDEKSVLYIPACTRIERCGGCCQHNLLECQPTEVENVVFTVVKTEYKSSAEKKLKLIEKIPVTVERHKKCKCGCKTKAEHCTPRQEYRENECKCVCRNTDEQKKCLRDTKMKLWDPDICECQCREEITCSTGTVFDWKSCKCVIPLMRRRDIEAD